MVTTTYEMEAMIRGYHVYATVWDAQIGEELDIALEGTALAGGLFESGSCESRQRDQLVKSTSVATQRHDLDSCCSIRSFVLVLRSYFGRA